MASVQSLIAGDGVRSVTDRSLQKKHRRQAASHSPWSQQDSGITLSTSMGMIGVFEITLIVPTLCVVTPPRTLRSAAQAMETVETVRLFMLAPNQPAQGKPVRVTGFGDAARQRQRFVVEPGGEEFGAQRGGDQST